MDVLWPGDPVQVGDYRLVGRLGAGGMGQVFLGRSPGGRPVAVKLIRREHAGSRQFRSRFAREVEAAKRVSGFHTAQVLDADPEADPPWMVTAYIPGLSLGDAVAGDGPLAPAMVRTLGAGLAEGLAAIHACGLVHRDLKPGNVILASDGPRIIDFGLARPLGTSALTDPGTVLGTWAFMSPEQVRGEGARSASDVFSLGCVLTFAATGRSPFAAESIPAIVYRITSERPDIRTIPEEHGLREVISACLTGSSVGRPSLDDILAQLSGPDVGSAWLAPAEVGRSSSWTSAFSDAPGPVSGSGETTTPSAGDWAVEVPADRVPHAYGGPAVQRGAANGRASAPETAAPGSRDSGIGLDEAAAELARAVGAQWHEEEERRRIHDPFPLPLRWHPAAAQLMDHWANIRRAPAGARPGPLVVTGRLEQITEVYRQIPSGRLVILGRGGAGKTIVALRFVLDMIASREPADAVPVILSAGSWDPATASLRTWLTGQLELWYPALAEPGPAGSSLAAALVGADRILPVLDGFDEIADGLHGVGLRMLNSVTMALVVTSRPAEYVAAVTSTDVLSAAAAIELDDLSLADLSDYLPRTTRPAFLDGRMTTVWDPILARLRDQPADPASTTLREVLSTPLMVTLARAIYSDTPGRDPADLLSAERFGTAEAVQEHLLDSFIPAAYHDPLRGPGDRRRQQRWDPARAQRYLSYIAWQLDRAGTYDLAVWRLGADGSGLTRGLAAAAGTALVFGLAGWLIGGGMGARYALAYALLNALAFGLASGVCVGLQRAREPSQAQVSFRTGASAYLLRLAGGFAVGGAFALAAGLGPGGFALSGVACGLALGAHAWLHRPTIIASVPSPREVLRRDRNAALAFGLAAALAFGTVGGLTASYSGAPAVAIPVGIVIAALMGLAAGALLGGLTYGRAGAICFAIPVTIEGALAYGPTMVAGLGVGLCFGITFGFGIAAITILSRAWGTYTVGRAWLAWRGRLPWPVMAFLADARRRGVLRQSGGMYQFRHASLQHRLAQVHQAHASPRRRARSH